VLLAPSLVRYQAKGRSCALLTKGVTLTVFWYALFVKTGYEHKMVKEIERVWRMEETQPFVPMYDTKFKHSGGVVLQKRVLFPGYVL
jgi:transcriptional antiterminator NusG